jgi:hypothetical protein
MGGEDMIKYIKAQGIKWRGGDMLTRGETKTVREITDWNFAGVRSKGRSKNMWKCAVLNDL